MQKVLILTLFYLIVCIVPGLECLSNGGEEPATTKAPIEPPEPVKPGPKGPDVVRLTHVQSASLRNSSFQEVGTVFPGRDFAQLFSLFDVTQSVYDFNHILKELDDAHERAIKVGKFKGFTLVILNASFVSLHNELHSVRNSLMFTCQLANCKERPKASRAMPDLVDSNGF